MSNKFIIVTEADRKILDDILIADVSYTDDNKLWESDIIDEHEDELIAHYERACNNIDEINHNENSRNHRTTIDRWLNALYKLHASEGITRFVERAISIC